MVHGRDASQLQRVADDIVTAGGRTHFVVGGPTLYDDVYWLIGEAKGLMTDQHFAVAGTDQYDIEPRLA